LHLFEPKLITLLYVLEFFNQKFVFSYYFYVLTLKLYPLFSFEEFFELLTIDQIWYS